MMEINARIIREAALKTGFIRDNLEKVMRLIGLLEVIFSSAFSNQLVLKGGTAINLFYAGMPRLSVDIDLDYVGLDRDAMLADKAAIKDWLSAVSFGMGYRISDHSKETHALDSYVLSYANTGGNSDNIKVEINFLDRTHILPLEKKTIAAFGYSSSVQVAVLAKEELYASKIAALVSRGKPRDLFDVFHALSNGILKKNASLRKAALFYDCVGGRNSIVSQDSFDFQRLSKKDFQRMLMPMLRKGTQFDSDVAIREVTAFLRNLFCFEADEIAFSQRFAAKQYCPELLFGDSEQARRIAKHPMALWRTKQDDLE